MDSVVRGLAVYLTVWMLFRIAGKRTLSEATSFDFVLLLIIGETTQQALLGQDFSITNAFLVIVTLIGIDVLLSIVKQHSPRVERILDGGPVLIVKNGLLLQERMRRERVDEGDILEAARHLHGLARMDQIKHAVLEPSGGISIVPR
jgi:uncharacterized membrane protein YcaP (DUF421 family)